MNILIKDCKAIGVNVGKKFCSSLGSNPPPKTNTFRCSDHLFDEKNQKYSTALEDLEDNNKGIRQSIPNSFDIIILLSVSVVFRLSF